MSSPSDSKPYRCRVCDRRFRRKDNVERHIRNTHRDRAASPAFELDHGALCEQLAAMDHTAAPAAKRKHHLRIEKTKLEMLNPLPPLSQDLLHKHMHSDRPPPDPEKSYIIEANNKRESVIFGPTRTDPSNEANEYVHKKKKFNIWHQKGAEEHGVTLPPIDNSKLMKIYDNIRNTDKFEKQVLEVPTRNIEWYKNILCPDGTEDNGEETAASQNSASPQVHWRRKIALNINW